MDQVPGADAVLETLRQAASQVPAMLKPAEQRLKEWETKPGFYSTLMQILCNQSLDVNIRWLAVLYIKNGIDKYWRKTASNSMDESVREFIRSHLIASFDEPVNQIATQTAVLIAKIARIDTRSWPELFPTLLEAVRSSSSLCQQRSLLVLNEVTKVLVSKRLASDRQIFRELANNIFSYIFHLWEGHTSAFFHCIETQDPKVEESLELSLLTLKVLRKLVIHGFKELSPESDQMSFIRDVLERLKMFLQCRVKFLANEKFVNRLEKVIITLMKVLGDVLNYHALSFVPLLRPALEFTMGCVFGQNATDLGFERFIVLCCNLVKAIVKCDSYRPPKEITDNTSRLSVEAYQVKMAFFTQSVLSEIIHRLVMNYFLMSKEELNNWEVDPEDFASEEVGESWKYQLRPSTEVLFLSLFNEFRSSVTQVVVHMVHTVQGCPESEDVNVLLQKDAVYNAAGLASYHLFDEMDFNQWFSNQLVREMQNKTPGNKILRRRIAWLAGQWINVKFSAANRPLLYENLLHLMSDTEDLVVRLTAANTLRISIDDVEFETEPFLPYLEPSVSALFNLLHHVKECDTKMHVLHVMSLLIERVSEQIRPFAASFSVYLPQLWQESGDHNMLRCAILTTVTHLVQGLGNLSTNLYPFMLPIVQLSTDVTQPPHVYLLEDGLELWYKMLENAPSLTPDLLRLFHNMPLLLESSSENLRTCFNIIECYILLNGEEFLKTFGSSVSSACESMLGNIKPEGGIIVARTIETAIKVFPSECVQVFQPALVKIFQLILHEEDYPPLMAVYLSIFAKIMLHNWTFFFGLLENMASSCGKQGDDIFGSFLDIWLERVDNMIKLERRKLTALALCSLLPLQSRCTSERFALILDVAVDVLHEVDRREGGVLTDCLVVSPDDNPSDDSETEDYKRRRELRSADPVHCIPLAEYVRTKLTECRNVYGETQFQSLMECLDSAVAQQLFVFVSS